MAALSAIMAMALVIFGFIDIVSVVREIDMNDRSTNLRGGRGDTCALSRSI
jgi:hypothetical protein